MKIAIIFILGILISFKVESKNFSFIDGFAGMLVDTCYDAMSIDSFLDCPEIDGCVSGRFSDFNQNLFDWSKLYDQWQWIDPNIDTTFGAWFHFRAISNDIDLMSCLDDSLSALLLTNVNCDSHDAYFSSELPVLSDFGAPGNNACVIGNDYFIYLYNSVNGADTFSICIDNEQTCSLPQLHFRELCEATPLCGLSDLVDRCYAMENYFYNGSLVWEPICDIGSLDNPHWFVFVAGDDSVEISMSIGQCHGGNKAQIQAYRVQWSDSVNAIGQCTIDLLSDPLLPCWFSQNYGYQGDNFDFGFTTIIGDTYALLIDGSGGTFCELTIDATLGSVAPNLDTFIPPFPDWNDNRFPFVRDTLCTGSIGVKFSTPPKKGIVNYRWSVNDTAVNLGVESSEVLLDFPHQGVYEICVVKSSSCSQSEVSCIEVVAKDFVSHTFHVDTTIQCKDSLEINARDYEGFEHIMGVNFTLPNGHVINADSFTISNPGKYIVSANECSDSVIINVLRPFEIYDSISHQDCYNASVIVSTSGIDNPKYTWSNGDTTSLVDSLTFGWYHVTISSTNFDCDFQRSYFIDFPDTCKATIKGRVSLMDTTTCGSNLQSYPVENQKLQINPIGIIVPTDKSGNYYVDLPPGVYQVLPVLNATNIKACPSSQFDTITTTSDTLISSFNILDTNACILTSAISSGPARPGRPVRFSILISNLGTTSRSFRLYGDLDDHYRISTFKTLKYSPPGWTGTRYFWDIHNLAPGARLQIVFRIELKVSAQNINTLSSVFTSDDCLADKIYNQVVRNSYDPNDKALHTNETRATDQILKSDSVLQYVVRFQNTGNDTAFFVQITDQLSDYLDITTFIPGPASHDYTWKIVPSRTVEFTFDPIFLPYQVIDDEGSQGFVSFEIKPTEEFMLNDSIQNNAAIFFDFNEPIITNTTNSRLERPQYIQEYYFELCKGDTFMSTIVVSDTLIEKKLEYFDFDSIYQYNLEILEVKYTEIDTIVNSGAEIFGITITNDTIISIGVTSVITGCDSIILYNIEVASGTSFIERHNIKVSPNPFTNDISISAQVSIQVVEIFDLNGKLIYVQSDGVLNQRTINMRHQSPGVYILGVTTNGVKEYFKIVKQ